MNVVELTKSLISCPSVTPNNEGVLDLLQKELTEMGFTCNRYLFSDTDTPDVDNLFAKIGRVHHIYVLAVILMLFQLVMKMLGIQTPLKLLKKMESYMAVVRAT